MCCICNTPVSNRGFLAWFDTSMSPRLLHTRERHLHMPTFACKITPHSYTPTRCLKLNLYAIWYPSCSRNGESIPDTTMRMAHRISESNGWNRLPAISTSKILSSLVDDPNSPSRAAMELNYAGVIGRNSKPCSSRYERECPRR